MSSTWIEYSGPGWTVGVIFLMLICLPTIYFQALLMSKSLDDMSIVVGIIITMFPIILGVMKTVFLLTDKTNYSEVYYESIHSFWPINWCSYGEEVSKKLRFINNFFWFVAFSYVITIQIWLFFPYATEPLPGHRQKPILIVYPDSWKADSFPLHHIISLSFHAIGFFLSCVIVGFDGLYIFIIYNTGVQFQLLNIAIERMAELPEEKIIAETKFIVDYHGFLVRLSKKISSSFANSNGYDVFNSVFLLSCFFSFYQEEEDIMKQIKLLMFLFVVIIHMLLYCMAGTWFITQQESVADAAYCSEWYNKLPNLRLSLMHIIRSSNRPQPLTAAHLIEVNCTLAVSVTKTAFSVATLFSK